jgi:hypothetical protein
MKTLIAALVAVSTLAAAVAPASAAFGPKDLTSFDGPGFGPADVRGFDGPAFGPADVRGFDGPAFGPKDVTSFDGPQHSWIVTGRNER